MSWAGLAQSYGISQAKRLYAWHDEALESRDIIPSVTAQLPRLLPHDRAVLHHIATLLSDPFCRDRVHESLNEVGNSLHIQDDIRK